MQPTPPKETLPRIRPCLSCHQDKPIIARGLCDACRQKEARQRDREAIASTHPAFGRKEEQESGTELLWRLLKILNKAKVPRPERKILLETFMPFSGYSEAAQAPMLASLLGPDPDFEAGRMDATRLTVQPPPTQDWDGEVGRTVRQPVTNQPYDGGTDDKSITVQPVKKVATKAASRRTVKKSVRPSRKAK